MPCLEPYYHRCVIRPFYVVLVSPLIILTFIYHIRFPIAEQGRPEIAKLQSVIVEQAPLQHANEFALGEALNERLVTGLSHELEGDERDAVSEKVEVQNRIVSCLQYDHLVGTWHGDGVCHVFEDMLKYHFSRLVAMYQNFKACLPPREKNYGIIAGGMDILHLVVALREGVVSDCVCYHRGICWQEWRSDCMMFA